MNAAVSMTTRDAIGIVAAQLSGEIAVGTTGFTCRDMQAAADRDRNFYMIGSMGLAASFGLGLALAKPRATVVVFDGDGAALMGLGNFAMIGALKPRNLIHLVFDNEVFASTGKQPTYSATVPLDAVAAASGYPVVRCAQLPEQVSQVWREVRELPGPSFVLIKCTPDAGAPKERVRLSPEQITTRFMEAVHES